MGGSGRRAAAGEDPCWTQLGPLGCYNGAHLGLFWDFGGDLGSHLGSTSNVKNRLGKALGVPGSSWGGLGSPLTSNFSVCRMIYLYYLAQKVKCWVIIYLKSSGSINFIIKIPFYLILKPQLCTNCLIYGRWR